MAIENLQRVGGHICLDFMNTVGDHLGGLPGDRLRQYADLVVWAQVGDLITRAEADELLRQSSRQPDAAQAALTRAIALREAVYRLLLCALRRQPPESEDVAALNQSLSEAPARTRIIADGLHYHWQTPHAVNFFDHISGLLAWSAADLLTSDQLAQLKVCEGDTCGWMFLDTSRNRSRRWCSMSDCGNRAKANRYYKRHKTE